MIRKRVTICNKLGLHARAAAKFVTLAAQFTSDIQLARGRQQVSGKSIMGVMMLAASQGTRLVIIAHGMDARAAVQKLTELIERRFDEAE
ncbi:MAG: HPr family phosphocarrier protein [Gammaproteobacteria bacterium]